METESNIEPLIGQSLMRATLGTLRKSYNSVLIIVCGVWIVSNYLATCPHQDSGVIFLELL